MKYTKVIASSISIIALLSACATTSEPRFESKIINTYELKALDVSKKIQTKGSITIEDAGDAKNDATPVRIHACDGAQLRYETKNYTYKGVPMQKQVKVMETVNPLNGLYVRRLKITNNSEHTLRINQVDSVLVDGAGIDHESMSRDLMTQHIRANIPCQSSYAVIKSLERMKIIGSDTRIRPGREVDMLVVFSGVDKSVLGDWTLELNDFPVKTNEANQVSKVTSFKFPLVAKGFRTTINYRKDSLFSAWKEINRETKEIQ